MSRSARRPAAVLALAGFVVVILSACSGPALPALTDPAEIITSALKATEGAKSVHIDVTLDGSISADLSGTGGPAASLPLTGTTAAADVDITGGKAHATFAVPAFLNLTGEVIQIGPQTFVKSSLTGPLFESQQAADALPVDPTDAEGMIDNVGDFLLADGVDPVKGDDVDCGGKQCYTVQIELTGDDLGGLGAVAHELPVDIGAASIAITVRVEKDTYHLAGIRTVASLGDAGSLTLDVTLSKWDEALDISPPPADQIGTGS